ncbi:G patch domain-containing protein TGH [Sesamum angolense]|uniref:G patch domain-containing protein TGH n=1 Tax=Sesamum angolense TaxID=2727404 RepID=A0AAE1X1E2_9LAMI|nr:G patch domain-containing protein TGH [Sesamum angolense]
MSSDDEDFVFYGTPIEREEEITTRKKKAIAEASGQLRTALPPWKQEVTDEEGRRRFHGAFTGGFSAGYYNTVGSKEGWTPQSFTSSRKNRAEVKKQNIYSFLDEDEKAELEGRSLGTSMQFDTFDSPQLSLRVNKLRRNNNRGYVVDMAKKNQEIEKKNEKENDNLRSICTLWIRPSTIPGPVPDELIVPATESIGVKLLLKMGWRQGRSIKDSNRNSLYDTLHFILLIKMYVGCYEDWMPNGRMSTGEARKAFLALSENMSSQIDDSKLEEEDAGNDQDLPIGNANRFSKSTPAYVLNPKQDLYGLGYDPFKHAPEFRGKIGPGFGIGALEDLDAEDEDVYASGRVFLFCGTIKRMESRYDRFRRKIVDKGYYFQDKYVQEIEEPSRVNVDTLRILDKKKDGVLSGFKVATNSESQLERFDPPVIPKDFVPHHKFLAPLGNDAKNAEIPPPEVPAPEDNNLKVLIEGVATLVARCGKLFEDLSREKNQSNPLFAFLSGGNGSDYYVRKLWEERQKRGEQTKLWEGKKPQNSEQLTAERRGKILGEKALEKSSRDSSSLVEPTASVNVQFKLSDTFTKPASIKDKVQQDEELITKAMYPKREEFQWRPAPILCKRFDLIDPYMGKAIFSDDSDDEEENTTSDQVEDTQKKIEVANTTLNRLIAGDFLESLGKELGLMVPPETPMPEIKAGGRGPQKEAVNVDKGNGDSPPSEKKRVAVLQKMKGAENARVITGINTTEAALQIVMHPVTQMIIETNTIRSPEEKKWDHLGKRVAAEGIQSTTNTDERILPVDHIVALEKIMK